MPARPTAPANPADGADADICEAFEPTGINAFLTLTIFATVDGPRPGRLTAIRNSQDRTLNVNETVSSLVLQIAPILCYKTAFALTEYIENIEIIR